jgi:tetratricopeptide (TPR) repeat protein
MRDIGKALKYLEILQKHQIGGDPDTSEGVIDLLYRKNPAAIDSVWAKHKVLHLGNQILLREIVRKEDGPALGGVDFQDQGRFTIYESFFSRPLFAIFSNRIRIGCEVLGIPYFEPVFGSLSLGDANASTFSSPDGELIVAVNSGLFAFLFKFSHLVSRCFKSRVGKEGETELVFNIGSLDSDALTQEQIDGFVQLWSDYGAYGYATDPVFNIVNTIELPCFPIVRCLFCNLYMFVLAHEYAHIFIEKQRLPLNPDKMGREIDADAVAFQICFSYIRSVSAFPLEIAAPVYSAYIYLKLTELRGRVSSRKFDLFHPPAAHRQAALLSLVREYCPDIYMTARYLCESFDIAVNLLWEHTKDSIVASIAAAPPLARFSDETQQYIWSLAGTLPSKETGMIDPIASNRRRSPTDELDETQGILSRLAKVINSTAYDSAEIRERYRKAFEEVANEHRLSIFEAFREAGQKKNPEAADDSASPSTADMDALIASGSASYVKFEFAQAAEAFSSASSICEKSGTPLQWLTINTLLCRSLHEAGEHQRALAVSEQLIRRSANYYGDQHCSTAQAHNNHGLLLKDQGHAELAEREFQGALAIFENQLGPSHEEVAIVVNNLALAIHAAGRPTEAISHFRRAISIDVARCGENSLEVGRAESNLAETLFTLNEYHEAETLYRHALAIAEQHYEPDHPQIAKRLNNLSRVLSDTSRFEESEKCLRKALAIHQAHYGTEHVECAPILGNLGIVLTETGKLDEAGKLMRTALEIDRANFGRQHPRVARDLNNLGGVLSRTNNLDQLAESEEMLTEAIEILSLTAGENHPTLASFLNSLSTVQYRLGKLDAAEVGLERALAIQERFAGPNLAEKGITLSNLSHVYVARGDLERGQMAITEALSIVLRSWYVTGKRSSHLQALANSHNQMLALIGVPLEEIPKRLEELCQEVMIGVIKSGVTPKFDTPEDH